MQGVSLDEKGHIQSACNKSEPLSDFNRDQLPTIVGEWTPAMTDCAKYLNGRGVGARYDGSFSEGATSYGSCNEKTGQGSSFSQDYKTFLRKMWEAQVRPYIALVIIMMTDIPFKRLSRLKRQAAGYSGRGKRSREMTGHILLVSTTVGSLKTQLTTYIPTYAMMRDVLRRLERKNK